MLELPKIDLDKRSLINLVEGPHVVKRQLLNALKIIAISLAVLFVISLFFTANSLVLNTIVILFLIIIFALWAITDDTTNIIANIMLWTFTVTASFLAWQNLGLWDSAIFIFPCILLLSSLLSGGLNYLMLLIFMVTNVIFFGYLHQIDGDFFIDVNEKVSIARAINITWILTLFALIIRVFIRDIRKVFSSLAKAKLRADRRLVVSKKKLKQDYLTGLPNETSCEEAINRKISEIASSTGQLALILLEINNFKQINSSFGYEIGDELLLMVAERLKLLVSSHGQLYRINGSEFVILYTSENHEEIANFAAQCVQVSSRIFSLENYEIDVQSLAGIACGPYDGDNYKSLSKNSHLALSSVQDGSDQYYAFFNEGMSQAIREKYELIQAMKKAITNKEFELHYQPKIDLASKRLIGAEALIRWYQPERGYIFPDVFIPIAESTNLINQIGKWVIQQACRDCKAWQDLGLGNISVAVNLSAVQFRKGNLPAIMLNALNSTELDPRLLEFEITESTMADDKHALNEQIQDMQSYGVSFSIDDFGTGYSNLSYLSQFNASTIKIDKSFVDRLHHSPQDQHIIKAIIQLAKGLETTLVAEGVEDKITADALQKLGCDIGQGYLWSKPLKNEDFIAFAQSNK